MKILYIGDIMGRPGRDVVARVLPALRAQLGADVVLAQSENVSHGKAMTPAHMRDLQQAGVDFFTGGNHSVERNSTKELLKNPGQPVIATLNQVDVDPAWGVKQVQTGFGKLLVVSLLGTTYPTPLVARNPLEAIDELLAGIDPADFAAILVNFHGDVSSEKRMAGYYLDGRVSAVVGDHWHVPTADAMVLPNGTAHITDVGMCGTLHSSLGVSKEIAIARWRHGAKLRNDIAEGGPYQLNGVLITVNPKTRRATHIKSVQRILPS